MTPRDEEISPLAPQSHSSGFIREEAKEEDASSSSSSKSSMKSTLIHLGLNRYFFFETVANAFITLFTSSKQPRGVPTLPRISKLSKNVVRILGGNPSPLTLQGTNTYLVGSGEIRWLIDAGDGRKRCQYGNALRLAMREHKVKRLHGILLTHWHPDHAFGVDVVRKACGDARLQAFKMVRKEKGEMAVARRTDTRHRRAACGASPACGRCGHWVSVRSSLVISLVGISGCSLADSADSSQRRS